MGHATTSPPTALVVMSQALYEAHFDQPRIDRLTSSVRVLGVVDELDSPASRALAADADVIVSTWGMPALTAERLGALPRLKAVFYCAGTVRFFATPPLWERGILVTSAAAANAVPVVEYTVAMIVLGLKKALFLPYGHRQADDGQWGDPSSYERTVGIVGLSSIGRGVARALPALLPTVRLVAYDPYATRENTADLRVELADLDEVCRRSDLLSIHAPDLPATYHMVGARQLALLPDHATVLNTARGRLLDHDALAAECAAGRLDAILDVTDPEPLPADHPLRSLPNVMLTPHIAGSRGTELRRMTDLALGDLEAWLDGRPDDLVGRVDPASQVTSA